MTVEVSSQSEGAARGVTARALPRLKEYLDLALQDTALSVSGMCWRGMPEEIEREPGPNKRYDLGIEVSLSIEVNSSERAAEVVKASLGKIRDYTQAAFTGTGVTFKGITCERVWQKRWYEYPRPNRT